MPTQGHSLHIGLNKVSQAHYQCLEELHSAINGAKDMQKIAEKIFRFSHTRLLTDEQAAGRVLEALAGCHISQEEVMEKTAAIIRRLEKGPEALKGLVVGLY